MAATVGELTQKEMRDALQQCDQALHHHEQWLESVYCTLICHLSPDAQDVEQDAHRRCRFGQWYYGVGSAYLARYPGFAAVEEEHRRVHDLAAGLLRASAEGRSISVTDYERFLNVLKRLHLEILTLKHEFEEALFNLDPLTGASSRIGMLTKLREQQELVRRKVQSCAIAMMDLDHFKTINDSYGHAAGDRVLTAIAQYVLANLRPYDKLFRYGGEEFLICTPNTDLVSARNLVDRLRAGLADLPHVANGQGSFRVTVSFGITLLDPEVPVEQSIERADKALYNAKNSGRNSVSVWDASMT